MTFSTRHLMSWHRVGGTLRAAVAALILAYVALTGETIHCQYFPATHSEHSSHSSSTPATSPDHSAHCLVASHGSSVAIDTHSSGAVPEFVPATRVVMDDLPSVISHLVRLTPARAPPVV